MPHLSRPLLLSLLPALALGCTTATTLADSFVEPLEARLGDPVSPAPGTVEARLAELEDRLAAVESGGVTERVATLEQRVGDLEAAVGAASDLADDALALASLPQAEIWGIGERASARIFNPDGSSGTPWTFPLDRDSPAVVRLERTDCAHVLLSVSMTNSRSVGDQVGLTIGPEADLKHGIRIGALAQPNSAGNIALSGQVWVPTNGTDRIRVRTIGSASNNTVATLHHIGCITAR
jgi:hypothetical protein